MNNRASQTVSITGRASGGFIFTLKDDENPDGGEPRILSFTDFQIAPLGYDKLAKTNPDRAVTLPLEIYNATIIPSEQHDIPAGGYAKFSTTIETLFTLKHVSLVKGGWLPSGMAATQNGAIILLDRNMVTEIKGRFVNGSTVGRTPDFIDMFANAPICLNCLPFALEGNGRQMPDAVLAQAQLNEAREKMLAALPEAQLPNPEKSLRGLLGLLEDVTPVFKCEQTFLKAVAPRLATQVASRDVDRRWDEARTLAREHNVKSSSLALLAVLSVIANPKPCPARKMLKFKKGYVDADAYNALSDLNFMKIMLYCIAMFPDAAPQFCTGDRNMALFWVGLNAHKIANNAEGKGITYRLDLHPEILPPKLAARWNQESRVI